MVPPKSLLSIPTARSSLLLSATAATVRRSTALTSTSGRFFFFSSNSGGGGTTAATLTSTSTALTTPRSSSSASSSFQFQVQKNEWGNCTNSILTRRTFASSSSSSSVVPSSSSSSSDPVLTSTDGVVATSAIDFDVASQIQGSESQILTVQLEPGQVLRAESGAMMYMTDGVEMNTSTGGGLSTGFQRMLTGQNFFISDYAYNGEPGTKGTVALGTDFPSKIVRLNVPEYGGKIVCQKGALLCASHTIDVQMEFTQNIKTGFFGGEGFVLQALTGNGEVFVKAGGTLIRRDLKEGEKLRVSSGCLVAFVDADYDVQMVQGFANVFAGGEGLFMTTFTGPGIVWLQGQPPQRMISEIARRVPSGGGIGLGIPILGGGSGGGEGGGGESGGGETTGN